MERIERHELPNGKFITTQKAKSPNPNPVRITKENFFKYFTPSTDEKVVTRSGAVIKSELILTFIKDLKQCMGKNDFDGFRNLLINDHDRRNIPDSECHYLYEAVMTNKGHTLWYIIDEIDDLCRDGYLIK